MLFAADLPTTLEADRVTGDQKIILLLQLAMLRLQMEVRN